MRNFHAQLGYIVDLGHDAFDRSLSIIRQQESLLERKLQLVIVCAAEQGYNFLNESRVLEIAVILDDLDICKDDRCSMEITHVRQSQSKRNALV